MKRAIFRAILRHQHLVAGSLAALLTLLGLAALAPGEDIAKPAAIYGLSVGADFASTAWAESRGGMEANPLLQDHDTRYALGVASVAGLTVLDVKLQRDGHRGWARALRVVAVVVRGYAVAHNLRAVR